MHLQILNISHLSIFAFLLIMQYILQYWSDFKKILNNPHKLQD